MTDVFETIALFNALLFMAMGTAVILLSNDRTSAAIFMGSAGIMFALLAE